MPRQRLRQPGQETVNLQDRAYIKPEIQTGSIRTKPAMKQRNAELAESLYKFVTVWKLIGKPFAEVDLGDRPVIDPGSRLPGRILIFLFTTRSF